MRDFDEWLSNFRNSIADYKYYTNFDGVYKSVDALKVELNILNSLIGSQNINQDFATIIEKYPEVLKCIPILLAKREREILVLDSNKGHLKYCFDSHVLNSKDEYQLFMRETGLFELLEKRIINSLIDYVTGVEVGLDSNGRKNRGGHLMENLVEAYLIKTGLECNKNYFKEMTIRSIEQKWNIDLSAISNKGHSEKRFDFVVKGSETVYGIETNFYQSHGSKLNETARSYKSLAIGAKEVNNFKFVWITDGIAWNNAKNNLRETFEILDDIYNIKDLEQGVLKNVFS